MLISQRIAKDPAFLRKAAPLDLSLTDVRLKIVRATKVIVGKNQMDLGAVPKEMMDRRNKKNTDKEIDRDMTNFRRFAKMPYPVLVFENDSGLKLVEELGERKIQVTTVNNNGIVIPFTYTVDLNSPKGEKHVELKMNYSERLLDSAGFTLADMSNSIVVDTAEVYEMILFLNVGNKVTHHYVPSKKENSMVPKPLLPFYSYHVIDVFRDRKRFVSLTDVDSFMRELADDQRRAHMVRGHWKTYERNEVHQIYWWNPFMRSRKNLETKGFVDKGYRLRDDAPSTRSESDNDLLRG